MKQIKIIGLLLLTYPIAAWAISNPIKILFPQMAGVSCIESWLCVEDLSKANEARKLYLDALSNVESKLTEFDDKPLLVFCSTLSCFSNFGFDKAAGQSIGSFGAVIAPRGWKPHYIEHELIHQWQSETFGTLDTWMAPSWLTEGMAYSLSDDPRERLSEPYQTYRAKFERLYGGLEKDQLRLSLASEI